MWQLSERQHYLSGICGKFENSLFYVDMDKDLLHREVPPSTSKSWKLKPSKQKCPQSELLVNCLTLLNTLPSSDCKTWFPQRKPCKYICLTVGKWTILRQVLLHLQAYRKQLLDRIFSMQLPVLAIKFCALCI